MAGTLPEGLAERARMLQALLAALPRHTGLLLLQLESLLEALFVLLLAPLLRCLLLVGLLFELGLALHFLLLEAEAHHLGNVLVADVAVHDIAAHLVVLQDAAAEEGPHLGALLPMAILGHLPRPLLLDLQFLLHLAHQRPQISLKLHLVFLEGLEHLVEGLRLEQLGHRQLLDLAWGLLVRLLEAILVHAEGLHHQVHPGGLLRVRPHFLAEHGEGRAECRLLAQNLAHVAHR